METHPAWVKRLPMASIWTRSGHETYIETKRIIYSKRRVCDFREIRCLCLHSRSHRIASKRSGLRSTQSLASVTTDAYFPPFFVRFKVWVWARLFEPLHLLFSHVAHASFYCVLPLSDDLRLDLETRPHQNFERQYFAQKLALGDHIHAAHLQSILGQIKKAHDQIFEVFIFERRHVLLREVKVRQAETNVVEHETPRFYWWDLMQMPSLNPVVRVDGTLDSVEYSKRFVALSLLRHKLGEGQLDLFFAALHFFLSTAFRVLGVNQHLDRIAPYLPEMSTQSLLRFF